MSKTSNLLYMMLQASELGSIRPSPPSLDLLAPKCADGTDEGTDEGTDTDEVSHETAGQCHESSDEEAWGEAAGKGEDQGCRG